MSNLFVRTLFAEVKNASPAQDEQQDRSKNDILLGEGVVGLQSKIFRENLSKRRCEHVSRASLVLYGADYYEGFQNKLFFWLRFNCQDLIAIFFVCHIRCRNTIVRAFDIVTEAIY